MSLAASAQRHSRRQPDHDAAALAEEGTSQEELDYERYRCAAWHAELHRCHVGNAAGHLRA